MGKDKYEFIHELLNDKKLTPTQRESVLNLTAKEIIKDKEVGIILEERVKRIENKIGLDDNIEETNFQEIHELITTFTEENTIKTKNIIKETLFQTHSPLSKYFHPSSLYIYLFEYNQNRILKSTCHEIDANALDDILDYCETDSYQFLTHLEKINLAFEEHEKKYFCNPTSKALIRGYITGKDYYKNELRSGWSSDKIKMNWSHLDLLQWTKDKNIPPNLSLDILRSYQFQNLGFEGFTSNLFGKRIQTFRELVLHFKSLFHIRSDNSLKSILNKINILKDFSSKIQFELNDICFPKNIELFTDVDKLIQAYVKFIELIIEQNPKDTKPIVKLSFYETSNSICLSIHHLNNKYNKSIQNTIDRMGQTYTNLINRQLNGMCNLYLRADFGNEGLAEINLWNDFDKYVKKDGLENFSGGVEHVLEFCKNNI